MTTNRSRLTFFTVALTLVLASAARSQEAGPGGKAATKAMNGLAVLTSSPEAWADLDLKPDQITKVRELMKELQAAQTEKMPPIQGNRPPMQGVALEEYFKQAEPVWQEFATNANKGLTEILDPGQLKRYRQIMLQVVRYSAFSDAEVQDALGMTEEQKAKYRQISDDFGKKVSEIRQSTKGDTRTAAASQLTEAMDKATAYALSLLSDDQKKAWSDLVGKEFKRAAPGSAPPRPRTP